jgi:hypothetical protein
MTSLDKPKESYKISERQSFNAEPYGFETFTSTHLADYLKQTSGAGDPSPQGSPDPEPMDAPFQDPDVLVYNDAVNSQNNVDMASTTNGDLYIVYDHDPGSGNRDVYVSKSTDAGATWNQRNIATDGGEDEYCPTIGADYSPSAGAELLYSFYTADQLEFRYSSDGDTWNLVDFGGGVSPFQGTCPDMDVMGDFIVVVGETVSPGDGRDTFRVLYTVDGSSWTSYYFNMWGGAWVYQPRVSIQSYDDVLLEGDVVSTMTFHDQSDPNPANWAYDAVLTDATLTGDLATDDWGIFYTMSGVPNLDPVYPDVEANGLEVIFNTGIYNPSVLPLTVHYTWCLFADDVTDIGSASWDYCAGTGFIAFDGGDAKDVKYVSFYRESTAVHAVWLNGTDINYYYSANGGLNFEGNSLAGGDPYKVNMPGVGTAVDAWRSPEVLNVGGKPCVAWHDTRGSNSIYFNTLGNVAFYEISTNPLIWDLWVQEVGDPAGPYPPPYSYLWTGGSVHDVETIGFFEIVDDTRYNFVDWDDGSLTNPTTITVAPPNRIVANYQTEYYLDMVNPGGITTPAAGYQLAGATVTIEAFAPAAPPGAQYIWIGWTGVGSGSYSGPMNPCTNCVVLHRQHLQAHSTSG